ncbi:MAG TPA: oxygenase MpaB family protein [Burkholderiales bacterium]|nr:oxygenase MpaB family protein [Burkholderiales bacterium]
MSRHLEEIRRLDPERDHQRIVFLSACYEFPFDTTRALEFALFRTYCVPSISGLLDRTGEFAACPQKRYDDTDLIVSELMEWGYDSSRGRRALRRMNQIHGRFAISNEDFLYVLSTFVFEPIRWNERCGWRPMCEQERLGFFHFWREVGRRMGIKDIPSDYEAFEAYNRAYEGEHYRFTETNRRIGVATRELFVSWFPKPFAPLVRATIHAMLDDSLITAFGFPRPPPLMRRLVPAALRLRGGLVRYLPPRRRPRLRTEMRHPTYPDGYVIEGLGPSAAALALPKLCPHANGRGHPSNGHE